MHSKSEGFLCFRTPGDACCERHMEFVAKAFDTGESAETTPTIGIATSILASGGYAQLFGPMDITPNAYSTCVAKAGGQPVLIPLVNDKRLASTLVSRLDGLIFVQGPDVDPKLYGASKHEKTDTPNTELDSWQLALSDEASRRDMPCLFTCRGHQLECVRSGGRMHQYIPDLVDQMPWEASPHGVVIDQETKSFSPGTHPVRLEPDSRIASILGRTEVTVNSTHKQAVAEAGTLTVTGRSPDGLIESAEDPRKRFWLTTQWHPEVLHLASLEEQQRLFDALVAAAREHARSKHLSRRLCCCCAQS